MVNYANIMQELEEFKEGRDFIDFGAKILKTNLKLMGVKSANIKKIIKKYQKEEIDNFKRNESYETNLIYYCIGLSKQKTLDEIYNFISNNKDLVDSWALTDTAYKYAKLPKLLNETLPLIDKLINDNDEFVIRFGYLFMFNFIKDKGNLSEIFLRFKNTDYFYVLMVEAWLLSCLLIYYFDETYEFIKKSDLNFNIKLKSISKGIDSYRISKENKNKLRELRNYLKTK